MVHSILCICIYVSLKLYGLVIYISRYVLFWYNILYCFLIYPYVVVSICINLANIPLLCIMAFPVVEFQDRDTKLERFLAKNQLYSNEITKF